MDTTMTRDGIYTPVGFGRAFLGQFRLLWTSGRPLLLLIGLLGLLALAGEPWVESDIARVFLTWPAWLLFLGPFWAFVVWHQEGPANRLYFWSNPVARTTNTLSRVAAGAAWLWLLYAVMLMVALLLAGLAGETAQFGMMSIQGWISLFAAPLLGYLIVSVLTVPSDYPTRWFLGLLLGIPLILSLLDEWFDIEPFLRRILVPLSHEQWGLGPTIVAPFLLGVREIKAIVEEGRAGFDPSVSSFDPATWWLAVPLWVLFWAGLVAFLATRHPDTYPRIRKSS